MDLATMLRVMHACIPAREWAEGQPDLATAWNNCQRPDWMLWLLNELGHRNGWAYRLFAVWSVRNTPLSDGRTVWDLLTDERSKNVLTVAERYANGEASQKELAAAWDAAWDAAWAKGLRDFFSADLVVSLADAWIAKQIS